MKYAALIKTDKIVTHILAFLIVNPFKVSLENFSTSGELNSLKVLAVTYDEASSNHKLFKMHFPMTNEDDINPDVDVTYKTINLFSKAKRFIYFIPYVPHLIKLLGIVCQILEVIVVHVIWAMTKCI